MLTVAPLSAEPLPVTLPTILPEVESCTFWVVVAPPVTVTV